MSFDKLYGNHNNSFTKYYLKLRTDDNRAYDRYHPIYAVHHDVVVSPRVVSRVPALTPFDNRGISVLLSLVVHTRRSS